MTDLMMDTISNTLGAATPMESLPRPVVEENSAKEDYLLARKNIREIIEQAMGSLPTMVHLMKEAQSDKMYSAGAAMFKTLTELNKDLAKLSKDEAKPDPTAQAPSPNQTNIQHQTVYVGTTEGYLARLKERRDQEQLPVIDVEVTEVAVE